MWAIENLERRLFLAGHGLSATYFNNQAFTGTKAERVDANISFDWGDHQSPAKKITGTTFAVRWDGLIAPTASAKYTIYSRNNDGVRIWINGDLVIDSSQVQPRATHSGSIELHADTLYDFRVEYFDRTRTAAIQLKWKSSSMPLRVMHSDDFYAYDTRLAAIADYGQNNDGEEDSAELVNSWAPDAIVTAGDNNDGDDSSIDENIGQFYGDYIGNYQGHFADGAATNHFWPSPGNHDWDLGDAYLDYFTLPGNERYYDFVQGPVHFFMLDSDTREPDGVDVDSMQAMWLKSALADSSSPFNVVMFHHSPYSSGEVGPATYMRWPFQQWGASLVISAHDHDYERVQLNGFTYLTDGTGASVDPVGDPIKGSKVLDNSGTGAILINANDLAMTLQYQRTDGTVVDTVTLTKS